MDIKNLFTNIAGYILIVISVIQAVLNIVAQWFGTIGERKPTTADWFILVGLLASGITALFTGRNADGSAKSRSQIIDQKTLK